MRNLRKHVFLGAIAATLCLSAFVMSASAQRYGGSRFSINVSLGSGYRQRPYYPRYRYYPRRVYRTYYAPPPVYYRPGYYETGYYNSGYYAPAYNPVYVVRQRRHPHRNGCNHYRRY